MDMLTPNFKKTRTRPLPCLQELLVLLALLFITFVAGCDIVLTFIFLELGLANELNPLALAILQIGGWSALLAFKALVTMFGATTIYVGQGTRLGKLSCVFFVLVYAALGLVWLECVRFGGISAVKSRSKQVYCIPPQKTP